MYLYPNVVRCLCRYDPKNLTGHLYVKIRLDSSILN